MLTAVSGTIPIEASPQLQTVLGLLDAFCNKEFEKVSSLLAEDYLHNLLPKSLGAPTRDKIGWASHIQELLKIHNNFKLHIHEIVEGQNSLTINMTSTSVTTSGADYANEYALFFELTPDIGEGVKVKRAKEFIDSKHTVEFFQAERARQESMASTM